MVAHTRNGGLVCGTEMKALSSITAEEQSALDSETLLRSVLDSARRIKDVAERHLDGPAQSAIIVVSVSYTHLTQPTTPYV